MGNSVSAARLTIVSIRRTGVINTVWAVFVAVAATLVLFHGGTAWQGLAILLAAHLLSATMVLASLRSLDHLPRGMRASYFAAAGVAVLMALLSLLRAKMPGQSLWITLVMIATLGGYAVALFRIGKRYHWLPSRAAINGLRSRALSFARRRKGQAHV